MKLRVRKAALSDQGLETELTILEISVRARKQQSLDIKSVSGVKNHNDLIPHVFIALKYIRTTQLIRERELSPPLAIGPHALLE